MIYRPYPNLDRARHQIDRHDDETGPIGDAPSRTASFAMPRIVISDEAREAMGARLASAGAALRHGFLVPEDVREAMRRTSSMAVSLQPLANMLAKRPVGGEEKTP